MAEVVGGIEELRDDHPGDRDHGEEGVWGARRGLGGEGDPDHLHLHLTGDHRVLGLTALERLQFQTEHPKERF